MIICHCQAISHADVHAAIDWMRAADPDTIITPGKIYRALGKTADCGSCMSLFLSTMRQNDNLEVPMHLRGLRRHHEQTQEDRNEGRRESHRLP
jgi:bacterioferritin-associated ferredoxin